MVSLTSVRNRINTVFTNYGTSGTYQKYVSNTRDKWGDPTVTYATAEAISIIPYNSIRTARVVSPFGELPDGSSDIVIQYSVSLVQRSLIQFNGYTWEIEQIEDLMMANGIAANIVRVHKITD